MASELLEPVSKEAVERLNELRRWSVIIEPNGSKEERTSQVWIQSMGISLRLPKASSNQTGMSRVGSRVRPMFDKDRCDETLIR